MKTFCLIWVSALALINVMAGLRQAWTLFRKRILVCSGVVVSSELNDAEEPHGGRKLHRMYWPIVKYEFVADGQRWLGDRISFAVVKTSVREDAEKRLGPYQTNGDVQVFYNADNPSEAWLKNPSKHVWTSLAWAIGMAFSGAAMNFMIWKLVK